MSAPRCSECGRCRLEGPDRFGNWDLDIQPGCPVHDHAPAPAQPIPAIDPYDKVQDHIAEQAHDGKYLHQRDVVRSTLDYEAAHDVYRLVPALARHPFGLPTVVAPPTPGDHPTGLRPVSPPPAGEQAGGLHLPDLAA